jgi:prophage tail gpP-like protein
MYVKAERARDPAGAARTAERFVAEANADLRTLRITVAGHGQRDRIYAINTMATVRDALAFPEPINERMLILDAVFTGSPGAAQTTQLTLGPQGAIVVTPEAA